MENDFDTPEVTVVVPSGIQQELLSEDTDQDFQTSRFWFRFQELERENLLLHNAFRLIHDCMVNESVITEELRNIIYRIAVSILEKKIAIFE